MKEINFITLTTTEHFLKISNTDFSQEVLQKIKEALDNHNTVNTVLKVELPNTIYYLNNFEYGKVVFKG